MSSYITRLVSYLSYSKTYVQEIADKVSVKAKRSGKSFKEYIHDNENVSHISLVVYDVLPLPLKFAIRYEKFNKSFTNNFSFIRKKLFDDSLKEAKILSQTLEAPKPSVKKVLVKKAVVKKAVVKKAVAKKAVIAIPKAVKPATKKLPIKKVLVKKVER